MALDSLRRVPLADLIAHTAARPAVVDSALKDAALQVFVARDHRLKGAHQECLQLLDRALPVLISSDARNFAVTGYLEQSHAEIDWGDYGAAIASLERAEQLIEQGVDSALAARVKAALGRIYSRIGNHQTAIRLLFAARNEAESLGTLNLAATWSINLSVASMRAWEASKLAGEESPHWLDDAMSFLDDAARFRAQGADDEMLGPLIDTNRACILTFRGAPEQAIALHAACDAFLAEHRVDALISSNRVDWAKALIAAGQLDQAKVIAESVVARARQGGHLFAQSEAMRLMADLFEARGDAKAALAALREHHSLSARVAAIEALQRADALQLRLETQRVKAEAEAAEARNAQLRALNARLSQQEAELRVLSEHDHLTGVANRRRFEARLDAMLAAHGQNDSIPTFAMGVIDIDHFKQINDLHSHAAGDAALCAVAQALKACLRQHDLPARLGGDEFAFIADETDAAGARDIGLRIAMHLQTLQIPKLPDPHGITLSIGIATAKPEDTREAMLARADRALYDVKRQGRNGVMVEAG